MLNKPKTLYWNGYLLKHKLKKYIKKKLIKKIKRKKIKPSAARPHRTGQVPGRLRNGPGVNLFFKLMCCLPSFV